MNSAPKTTIVVSIILGLLLVGAAKSSVRASQELAEEQHVVLAVGAGDIASADPTSTGAHQDRVFHYHVFGALVRYPDGDCTSGKLEPDLATKWEISPDRLTWTFHLRKGVKWHWGYGEFTSEDVVYSLNRVKRSKVSAWRSAFKGFKEIKAVDKYAVKIRTDKPDPFLLIKMANNFGGYILCKKALEKAGAFDRRISHVKEEAIGTGPFKFLEYKTKDRLTLIRNDDYWMGKPIVEKLTIRFIPEEVAKEMAILKGEVHAFNGHANAEWIRYIRSKGMIVEPMGPPDIKAVFFNLTAKPFNDKRVREAFAYACSQEAIMDMQGEEISTILTSPVPSGMFGHIDAGWHRKRDIEKAKKLLADAGYPNGLTIKILMSIGPWYLDKMIIWQDQLREVGVNLEMTKIDHTIYKKKIIEGGNPLVFRGTNLPLPTTWLRNFYHSDCIVGKPTANANYAYYSKPEVDKLIETAETAFDEKKRFDALAKAQRIIVEDLPSIPCIETRVPNIRVPYLDLGYEPKSNFVWNVAIGLKTKLLKH